MTDPKTPSDLGKRMMNMSFAMLAAIGVIAYFIYTGAVKPDEPVTLTVTTEQPEASSADKPIKLDLTVRLENNTEEVQALTAPTQCDVFRWFLTDDKKEFVQSQGDDKVCAQVTVSTALAARHVMTEKFPITLDPKRVHPGDYRFFVRYWGHEADVAVTIR